MNHCDLPDPISDRLKDLQLELNQVNQELKELKQERMQINEHSNL